MIGNPSLFIFFHYNPGGGGGQLKLPVSYRSPARRTAPVNSAQQTKPKATGSRMAAPVHLRLPVSRRMVRQVVAQGQCIRENRIMEQAVAQERQILSRLRDSADYLIDTSYLSVRQLREKVVDIFLRDKGQGMLISCMSFGFKYGIPKEADLVFDVRCLPNPFYLPELKQRTGLDRPVREYVMQWEQSQKLADKLLDLVDYLLPLYQQEGKTQLTIAMGCTGGHHRSVVFAQLMAEHLQERQLRCTVTHRDIAKG